MSLRADGSYRCDRCGGDIGNASVDQAASVSDVLVDDEGRTSVVVYHFCRVANAGAPDGCAAHVLIPSNLADFTASRSTDDHPS